MTSVAKITNAGPAPDPRRVEELLSDAASWWAAGRHSSLVPADALCLCQHCGACGELWTYAFQFTDSPYFGRAGSPIYRELDDLRSILLSTFAARPPGVSREDWAAAAHCRCAAPKHNTATVAASLFHAVVGSGASLLAVAQPPAAAPLLFRAPDLGLPTALDGFGADVVRAAFGRPLSCFDAWRTSATRAAEGGVAHLETIEPGAYGLVIPPSTDVPAALSQVLGEGRRVIVELEPDTIRSAAWPDDLAPLASLVETGGRALLAIERDALARQAALVARSLAEADLVDVGPDRLELRRDTVAWPFSPRPIALAMARFGRTLPEACAKAIDDALVTFERATEGMSRLVEAVPGGTFEVRGTRATARRPDGSEGRSIEVAAVAAWAGSAPEVLAREAAFLFDARPQWADPTRVCACGADATVQRRLVQHPWAGRPWVLRTLGPADGGARGAEVVALACDRHVRVVDADELRRLGLEEGSIEARIADDLPRARHVLRARVWESERGRALLATGVLAAGIALADEWLAAINAALGLPLEPGSAEAWAFHEDAFAIVSPELSDDGPSSPLALAVARLGRDAPAFAFAFRREVDLSVTPAGEVQCSSFSGMEV